MKNLISILIFAIGLYGFSQTEVDFSEMTQNEHLGNAVNIDGSCEPSSTFYYSTASDIDLNGYYITMSNSNFNVLGIEFGGAFKSTCNSKVIVNGIVFTSDPPDPGGNPFDINGIPVAAADIPQSFSCNGVIDLPDGETVGYIRFYELAIQQNRLTVYDEDLVKPFKYNRVTKELEVYNAKSIIVYDIIGKKLKSSLSSFISLEGIKSQILLIVTDKGSYKLVL